MQGGDGGEQVREGEGGRREGRGQRRGGEEGAEERERGREGEKVDCTTA